MTPPPAGRKEQPGPADFTDPLTQREVLRAGVWIGMAAAVVALWFLAQPLLLIVGGLVFAAILDGGTRLLGRILPIRRGWRLAIVTIAGFAFLVWTFYYAGATIAAQAETLRVVVQNQLNGLLAWGRSVGIVTGENQMADLGRQVMGSLGRLTSAVGSALGAVSSLAMILVIGIFVAIEPRLYERGFGWMLPLDRRDAFYATSKRMGHTLRLLMFGRLLGMAVEGLFTGLFAWVAGVPMAALIGLITGLMAFLPNIGAIVSGVLLVLVGFSAGFNTGIWAIVIYVAVQTIDGYLIVPMVAKRSVDLAPALVLGAQLLLGALFGILGLALADPIVAMIKVLLEEKSELAAEEAGVA
ncbi:AI-2E family transporter [uncultured Sphingomonas sp.]|uniref:AI-2E family transporter n=1 Tax=uncultured Sphingomonas sp. TaxID=158754 RepID=UPI0025EA3A39|nr:AI-2E family transporter [uncultured Sphingomonas sp.]